MEMNATFFLAAIPAVLFAAISKAGFGSGAAFAGASILALVVPPGLALGVMLPLLMLVDAVSLRPYWGKWSWLETRLLILGGVPGVAVGASLWTVINDDTVRFLIGLVSIGFVSWRIALSRNLIGVSARRPNGMWGVVTGVVAGFTSFISHAGGPPAAMYLLARKLDKGAYQATTVIVFWALNIAKAVPYAFLGMFTAQTLTTNLILAPVAILGTWLGVRAHQIISERAFFALTYVLLIATGTKLIWDALT